jgi:alpha-N-acetylglucosamine transferase
MGKMSYERLRDKRNKELKQAKADEAAVAQAEARVAQAIRETEDRVRREYEAKLSEYRTLSNDAIAEADFERNAEGREKNAALSKVSELEKANVYLRERLTHFENLLEASKTQSEEWKVKYLAHEPVEKALTEKIKELTALFARVQERMRRKEVEQMNAILNRQALAGYTPGVNRR